MKIAVIKLGSRISFNANDTSGGNGEARSIIKILEGGGAEVHIYTKILKKDNLLPQYVWHDICEDYEQVSADALLVINGNVNFFGGAEDASQILNYHIVNNFKGRVFYAYCDPSLTLKQVWPSVSKKPWANNWKQTDIEIVRDDITYLSQPHNTEKILSDLKKNDINMSRIIHYPFEQFPCLNESLSFNPCPAVDLSYGGTMRGGKREKKLAKFYFGHPEEISVEVFGKIEAADFKPTNIIGKRHPLFTGPVRYDEMLTKMNKAMAHCVIGDPYYEQIDDMSQRAYESIWSSVVTFIDADMDKLRRVYGRDRVLSDFLYVQDQKELSEKIILLKEDLSLRKQILEDQLAAVDFNSDQYCTNFVDLLN